MNLNLWQKSICFCVFFLACAALWSAQDAKIIDIKLKQETTPTYRESKQGSMGAKDKWCKIEAEYEIKGGKDVWANELEVNWFVMVESDRAGKLLALSQTVTYLDVNCEGKHHACVYIKPNFFKKYLGSRSVDVSKISAYCEIKTKGKKLAEFEKRSSSAPRGWYKMGDKMTPKPNELMPKSKTPFAPLDYDYYEQEKLN